MQVSTLRVLAFVYVETALPPIDIPSICRWGGPVQLRQATYSIVRHRHLNQAAATRTLPRWPCQGSGAVDDVIAADRWVFLVPGNPKPDFKWRVAPRSFTPRLSQNCA